MQNQRYPGVTQSTSYRVITAGFGIFFVAIAMVIVLMADRPMTLSVIGAAVVIGVLGLDAVRSAFRGTTSWLARIGPLP